MLGPCPGYNACKYQPVWLCLVLVGAGRGTVPDNALYH
jgi:hypothetical protein